MNTYVIIPAWSDQAGYCRIVSRDGEYLDALTHYRAHPQEWAEAGRMNSQGKLVYLDAPPGVLEEFKSCEPLMAGLQIRG